MIGVKTQLKKIGYDSHVLTWMLAEDMEKCSDPTCAKWKKLTQFPPRKNGARGIRKQCYDCLRYYGQVRDDQLWHNKHVDSWAEANNKKRCGGMCNRWLDRSCFHRGTKNDGLAVCCIDCASVYAARHYQKNKQRITERRNRQSRENPDLWRNYRANRKAHTGFIPDGYMKILGVLQDGVCLVPECKYDLTDTNDLTLDHVVPISLGGMHELINFQLLCRKCNAAKGNRNETDYRPDTMRQALLTMYPNMG